MDLISRQALIDAFEEEFYQMYSDDFNYMVNWIKNLPTIDLSEYSDKLWETAYERGKAETRPKGKWENTGECEERGTVRYICSECGRDDWHFPLSKISYCWNCGARMEG